MNEIDENMDPLIYDGYGGERFNDYLQNMNYDELRDLIYELTMKSDPIKRRQRNFEKHFGIKTNIYRKVS